MRGFPGLGVCVVASQGRGVWVAASLDSEAWEAQGLVLTKANGAESVECLHFLESAIRDPEIIKHRKKN